jgi:hypothetical protein
MVAADFMLSRQPDGDDTDVPTPSFREYDAEQKADEIQKEAVELAKAAYSCYERAEAMQERVEELRKLWVRRQRAELTRPWGFDPAGRIAQELTSDAIRHVFGPGGFGAGVG